MQEEAVEAAAAAEGDGSAAAEAQDDFAQAASSETQHDTKWQQRKRKEIAAQQTRPSSLLAVVTANIWNKTELLLQSLTANSDAFEVLVSMYC